LKSLILKTIFDEQDVLIANKTAGFRGIFINRIIKFAKSITGSIAGVTTSVAPHEVLRKSFTPAFFLAV
jgi:hypothetical protein